MCKWHYTYHAKFYTYLACHVILVYTNLHGESVCVCVFFISFTWPQTNVFDRVGFGKEKTNPHVTLPTSLFFISNPYDLHPHHIYLFIYFPYSLLYSLLGFKKLFLPKYFFYPSTTPHFSFLFFSLSFSFSFFCFGWLWWLVHFGFFVLFVWGIL